MSSKKRKNEQKRTSIKKKQFLSEMASQYGNVSKACKKANIGRTTYYEWLKKDKEFAQKISDIQESLIDWGEDALKARMHEKDTAAIIFFLKTKGKSRGYIERQELAHKEAPVFEVSDRYMPKIKEERNKK